jgi:hypothetical protein
MVTTIQLSEQTKEKLKVLKETPIETYETVITRLLEKSEEENFEELLKEGYLEMAEESLKITKEFEPLDAEIDIDGEKNQW